MAHVSVKRCGEFLQSKIQMRQSTPCVFKTKHCNTSILMPERSILNHVKAELTIFFNLAHTFPISQTILETLRLYPAVSRNTRISRKERTLNNIRFPAGSRTVTFYELFHKNEKYWKDPEEFRPLRSAIIFTTITPFLIKLSRSHQLPFFT